MPTNNRLLRSRKAGKVGFSSSNNNNNTNNGGEEDETSLEMSGASTLACVIILLIFGASLATSYILIYAPGCVSTKSISKMTTLKDGATPGNIRTPPSTPAVTSPVASPVAAPVPAPKAATATTTTEVVLPPTHIPGFPDNCSADQMTAIQKQLPPDDCDTKPYTFTCSFSQATIGPGCRDSIWMREFYANSVGHSRQPFRAVFVNNGCSTNAQLAEVMRLGGHSDTIKFPVNAGDSTTCKQSVPFVVGEEDDSSKQNNTPRPVLGICFTNNDKNFEAMTAAKETAGLGDKQELRVEKTVIGAVANIHTKTLDGALYDIGDMVKKPIHYLLLGGNNDPLVLKGAIATLSQQVRYLEFEYNWEGSWDYADFKQIIEQDLAAKHNFVCYWNGVNQNLWRITGCWQPHYGKRYWSRIACVSAKHADTKPLLEKMEATFEATLQKTQRFGGA